MRIRRSNNVDQYRFRGHWSQLTKAGRTNQKDSLYTAHRMAISLGHPPPKPKGAVVKDRVHMEKADIAEHERVMKEREKFRLEKGF